MVSSWPGEMRSEWEPALVTLSSLASTIFPVILTLPDAAVEGDPLHLEGYGDLDALPLVGPRVVALPLRDPRALGDDDVAGREEPAEGPEVVRRFYGEPAESLLWDELAYYQARTYSSCRSLNVPTLKPSGMFLISPILCPIIPLTLGLAGGVDEPLRDYPVEDEVARARAVELRDQLAYRHAPLLAQARRRAASPRGCR